MYEIELILALLVAVTELTMAASCAWRPDRARPID
jgi:hypothetical protein